ncbi:YfhO family protein [Anaerorhabdus sp.]|uniref:YfhO family protein n=1 Tax=Anaerorhabdus sp. TaxID=1872524 RepID=UPI002FC81C04
MKKEFKHLLILGILTSIVCLAMFLPNILNHLPVIYGTDLKPEQVFFNMEFTNLMNNFFKTGTLPFYSWSMFLGTNYWASQTFYNFGDIFTWLTLLVQQMNFFDKTLLFEIIKFFVSSYSMYFLLKEMKIETKIRYIGALAFAFSGWAIFFSGQLMFHSFYCLVPLYFLGIERYIRDNKKILFLVMVTILLISNWYYFYTLSLFTTIYFTYRYYLINKGFNNYFKNTFKIIGVYLIGVLICSAILLPTIFYMSGNNRIGISFDLLFGEKQVYLHLLASMFAPNYLYIYRNNVFETNWHVTREICLYAGSIVSLLTCQIFAYKDKIFKNASFILYGILIIIAIIPMGNAVMHGFSEPSFRWVFLLVFLNIITTCHLLNNFELFDKSIFKRITVGICIFVILIVPITAILSGTTSELLNQFLMQWTLFIGCSLVIALISFLLIKKFKNTIKILVILTVVEFSIFGSILYITNMDLSGKGTYEFFEQVTHVLQDEEGELNNHLDYLNEDNYGQYYRVYVPHDSIYWYYSHNMSIAYQLNGLMVYFSTYSPSVNKLKELAPQIIDYSSAMIFNITDPEVMSFLNVKYALVLNENELPPVIDWKLVDDNYRGSIKIYENQNYRALGTTYSKVISSVDFIENKTVVSELNNTIVAEEKDLEEISSYLKTSTSVNLENVQYGGNQLTGTVISDEKSFMVITLPFDEGWKVLVNGQEVKKYEVNGGFIGIPIEKGDNSIEMYFTPKGFKIGVMLSGVGLVLAGLLISFELIQIKRRKKNLLKLRGKL